MSWDVSLLQDGNPVTVERHQQGCSFCIGGVDRAEMSVTYNYSAMFNFRKKLNGKTASETIPVLERFVKRWGTNQYSDYWAPTPGNIGHACNVLLGWARQHPDAVWEVE